jgi:hypothetical protein
VRRPGLSAFLAANERYAPYFLLEEIGTKMNEAVD